VQTKVKDNIDSWRSHLETFIVKRDKAKKLRACVETFIVILLSICGENIDEDKVDYFVYFRDTSIVTRRQKLEDFRINFYSRTTSVKNQYQ
jgi:hypothetical protein